MKKLYPYLGLIFCILISSIFWDYIKIPFNESNKIYGEFYLKKYNPVNEILRFLIFVFFPLLVFFGLTLKQQDYFNLYVGSPNFFINKKKSSLSEKSNLNFFLFIFLMYTIIDFFSLKFENYVTAIDTLHDGVFLAPPKNYIFFKKFWTSSIYDYGILSNNVGLFFYAFFDNYTIGSIRFFNLFLIFLNKILILLICKKIIETISLNQVAKSIFFILLVFLTFNLTNYEDISSFPPRAFLFLLFLYICLDLIINKTKIKFKSLIVGSFSLISLLWYLDIGVYINSILLILVLYFLLMKKFKIIFFIFFGIITSWVIFLIILPQNEINEFFFQVQFLINTKDYIIGIQYPKPFSDGSTRFTRALLLVILAGVLIINLLFSKKINLNYETKIILLLIFISSIIFFKSALGRTDTPHIKYSSGLYLFLIYFSISFFLINFFIKKEYQYLKFLFEKKYLINLSIFLVIIFSIILNDQREIKNLLNIHKNITKLTLARDNEYLSNKQIDFINDFKTLSIKDNCVQVFTGDISISYLLNKPSCTQFYLPSHIISGWTEERFIIQLKKSNPQFIVYNSGNNWLIDRRNMKLADEFIKQKYFFFKTMGDWEIYKRN